MASYFLKVPHGIEQFRLVGVTGRNSSGLLRVVDVGPTGEPLQPGYTWLPPNPLNIEMEIGPNGFLVERDDNDNEEEIDWQAHEDGSENLGGSEEFSDSNVSSVSPSNPAMAAYPQLAGE